MRKRKIKLFKVFGVLIILIAMVFLIIIYNKTENNCYPEPNLLTNEQASVDSSYLILVDPNNADAKIIRSHKIKTIQSYINYCLKEKIRGNLLNYSWKFDTLGRLIEKKHYLPLSGKLSSLERYEYDNYGSKITSEERYYSYDFCERNSIIRLGYYSSNIIYNRNSKTIATEIYTRYDGSIRSFGNLQERIYNEKGLLKQITIYRNNVCCERTVYSYNESQLVAEIKHYIYCDVLESTETFEYNNKQNKIKYQNIDEKKGIIDYFSYRYDSLNNLISIISFDNDSTKAEVNQYVYNSFNKLVSEYSINKNGDTTSFTYYKYDDYSRLTETNRNNKFIDKYSYSDNNIISIVETWKDNPIKFEYYQYEYY